MVPWIARSLKATCYSSELPTARWEAAYCLLYMTQALTSICDIDLFLDTSYHSTKLFKSRELKVKMFLCKPKGRRARLNNLWHSCPKWQEERFFWHSAFHAVQSFYISFARPESLYCKEYVYICSHIWLCRYCVWITVDTNNIESETFLHKSEAVRSVDWIFITRMPAWRWLGEYVTLDRTFYSILSNRK